jgi:hypothetical protein
MVDSFLYTEEVRGSNPFVPTIAFENLIIQTFQYFNIPAH